MHVKLLPSESKVNKNWNIVTRGVGFLLWGSPFLGLGVFFPLGVLVLYRLNHTIRAIAFQILLFQIIAYGTTFPFDFVSLFYDQTEAFQADYFIKYLSVFLTLWFIIGLVFLFKEAQNFNKIAFFCFSINVKNSLTLKLFNNCKYKKNYRC